MMIMMYITICYKGKSNCWYGCTTYFNCYSWIESNKDSQQNLYLYLLVQQRIS